ncbi:uncharacterized protein F5147DRAFT_649872 [Suillus discolor]|uniref:Fungal-type protein kinase domain-containing protein n=1 Tax=Suillus discolor TaxID=1912936 RepID=A0A9P7FDA3_9AGAM|nr:uncharacterized protein F5147DRAFT_649872 [Suillus discolor]KAG2114712.1 hypothetical protein F5147DRAFT_649872 [Suillus discolor]
MKSKALSKLLQARERPDEPSDTDPPPSTSHNCYNDNDRPSNADPPHNTSELPSSSGQKITKGDLQMMGHVPDMVWFHRFNETSTTNNRTALGMKDAERGNWAFSIIVCRKLEPVTNLIHRILWEDGIYRCDISLSNLVFYRTSRARVIGVLNDYDLSSIQDDCPRGNKHTGTVPFLSISLFTLLSAVEGSVEHVYRHDVESLAWVSVWSVFAMRMASLARRTNLSASGLIRVDALTCCQLKCHFLMVARYERKPRPLSSHRSNWILAIEHYT